MSAFVKPEEIESQLVAIWEKLAKENKTRACLFNLIVFNRYSPRTDYIRSIVQKVIEKFPCRLLFISEDPDPQQPYLKAAVSVLMSQDGQIACDHIDIGAAGVEIDRVPYVLLPHILPDLPVVLLWAEDPCKSHPLFAPLTKLAHRIIFDSESADNLLAFSKTVLALSAKVDIADLNWARTEGWRDLLSTLFAKPLDLSSIKILYNAKPTEFFLHLKIQSMYLLSWLASRLKWTLKKANPKLQFQFERVEARIESTEWEKIGPGTILSVCLTTVNQEEYACARIRERYHHVLIQNSSPEKCELPYQFVLGQTATGQSLVKEICMKGTSQHYLDMLKYLQILDKDQVC